MVIKMMKEMKVFKVILIYMKYKKMIIFKNIVGEDSDTELLLNTALSCAKSRVVVKRPRITKDWIGNHAPSFSFEGSSCRFDVYLTAV